MAFRRRFRRGYRRVFGHKSPFRRVFGSRNAGQAIGVTYRQALGPAREIAKIAAEVRGIKARQNVEKKHKQVSLTGADGDEQQIAIGQTNGTASGVHALDITPTISQGINANQRVGNSCKLTGISMKYQLIGQTACMTPRTLKYVVVKVSSPDISSVSTTEVKNMIWDTNPLTNIVDMNSPVNYTTLRQNGIKIMRTGRIKLGKAVIEGSAYNATYEAAHKTGTIALSLQEILRFYGSSSTTPEAHKYFMFIFCDVGNSHGSTGGRDDCPISAVNTGVHMRMHGTYWWVDN